jgi:cytochrome b6-f complex iron-sulfur subunit
MIMGGIGRYVEDLLRSRRPRRFRATGADTGVARTAVTLRAARPGSGAPREEFVTGLHRRLAAELDSPAPRPTVSRRRMFLRTAGVAAGAAVAGAGIDHALGGAGSTLAAGHTPAAGPTPAAGTMTFNRGVWLTVARSVDLPDGAVRPFTAGAVTGFVERAGGRPRAVSGICTHQGCRLALAAGPERLVCPCHGATFALDGAVLTHRLPLALAPLPRLAVREVNGTVQIYAPAPGHRPPAQP